MFRSLEDIEQHFDWFRKMQELGDKKKYAITQWRKHKDQEREVAMKNKANELGKLNLKAALIFSAGYYSAPFCLLRRITIVFKCS